MNQKRRADLDVICRKLNDMQEELYRIQRSEEKTYVRIPEAITLSASLLLTFFQIKSLHTGTP